MNCFAIKKALRAGLTVSRLFAPFRPLGDSTAFSGLATQDYSTNSADKTRTYRPFKLRDGRELTLSTPRPEEADEIFEFLIKYFFPLPPLRQIHRFDDSDEAKRPLWKLEQIRRCLLQPYSLVARNPSENNRLIAVNFNDIKDKPFSHGSVDPKDRSAGWVPRALTAELNRGVDFYSMFNVDRVLHGHTGAVVPEYVSTGIVSTMFQLLIKAGGEDGIGAAKGEAYTVPGQKVMSKNGFILIRTIKYDEFCIDGEYPLAELVKTGDKFAQLYARRLPNENDHSFVTSQPH